jgi:broad specificity phosphatase PhoE
LCSEIRRCRFLSWAGRLDKLLDGVRRKSRSESIAMENELPVVYLARHGETAWSLTGRHTGLTDLPLTERGEHTARRLGQRLKGLTLAKVLTSPLQRAHRTCELAGFAAVAEIDPDLVEWNYGQYEGRRGNDIRAERPGWNLFRDGCPGGETQEQVSARADRVVSRVRAVMADVLLFTSGHFIRVLAARWLGLEPTANSRYFMLSTASLSALGYENELSRPVIRFWNDTRHVDTDPEIRSHAAP